MVVAPSCFLAGRGRGGRLAAAGAVDGPPQLGDPGGSGGGHQQGPGDDGQQQGDPGRQPHLGAQEAELHGLRVLRDEDHQHDQGERAPAIKAVRMSLVRVHRYQIQGRLLLPGPASQQPAISELLDLLTSQRETTEHS
jgi:hypothetical protein